MQINESLIEQINDDIEQTIQAFVPLKPINGGWIGLCPFHSEKTPSFRVSKRKNIFKCFGCGEGGDAIHFVEKHEMVGFIPAVEKIAKLKNIKIDIEKIVEFNHEESENFIINDILQKEYVKGDLSYFNLRCVNSQSVKEFGLGFCSTALPSLKQYNTEQLIKNGVISTEKHFEYMSNRQTFPIFNKFGKIVGFGGRKDSKTHKYINSPDTAVYHKSKVLYNYYKAEPHIKAEGFAIIVEGFMDVIMLWQFGIKNVVAINGTSFTPDHAKLLKKASCGYVLFILDGDTAGEKATNRGLEMCLRNGLIPKYLRLPKDPDEMVQELGTDKFKELFDYKTDFIESRISEYRNADMQVQNELLSQFKDTIKNCNDKVFRINLINIFCKNLGITPSIFDENLSNFSFKSDIKCVSLDWEERFLKQLYSIKNYENVLKNVCNSINGDFFSQEFNSICISIVNGDLTVLDKYQCDNLDVTEIDASNHILNILNKHTITTLKHQNETKIKDATNSEELKLALLVEQKILTLI